MAARSASRRGRSSSMVRNASSTASRISGSSRRMATSWAGSRARSRRQGCARRPGSACCRPSARGVADVVLVDGAATMGGCADEVLAAVEALEQAGEQEIGGERALEGSVVAALLEDRLRLVEDLLIEDGVVESLEPLVSPGDVADVHAVAEDGEDALVVEQATALVPAAPRRSACWRWRGHRGPS